eukprot:5383523-Pleurochrysis_carterae.AAC.4
MEGQIPTTSTRVHIESGTRTAANQTMASSLTANYSDSFDCLCRIYRVAGAVSPGMELTLDSFWERGRELPPFFDFCKLNFNYSGNWSTSMSTTLGFAEEANPSLHGHETNSN